LFAKKHEGVWYEAKNPRRCCFWWKICRARNFSLSAKNIYEALDQKKYEPLLIGIDKNGEWHVRDSRSYLSNANHAKKVALQGAKDHVALVSKQNNNSLVSLSKKNAPEILDVIFPVMHGTYGEDGAIQGLLKMAGIPFVGAGILGSAVGMDKDVMKRLCAMESFQLQNSSVCVQKRLLEVLKAFKKSWAFPSS